MCLLNAAKLTTTVLPAWAEKTYTQNYKSEDSVNLVHLIDSAKQNEFSEGKG